MNLTQRPPRSPRVRLGGYAILPRIIDKCRADIAGTLGEYAYNCSLDRHFFNFTGIDANAFKAEVASGKGDGALLQWVTAQVGSKLSPWAIIQWSSYHDSRGPSGAETLEFFAGKAKALAATREDVATWFELLDLDDYVSFGGQA